jgi:hypothetical protein
VPDGRAHLRPVVAGQVGADHPAHKHGATSEARIRPIAARRKRTFLRRNGLRVRDLDPVARSRVEQWARLSAQVELLDAYFAEHGLLRDDGTPQGATAFYVSLCNSLRLATDKLDVHVRARERDPHEALHDYLRETYGDAS